MTAINSVNEQTPVNPLLPAAGAAAVGGGASYVAKAIVNNSKLKPIDADTLEISNVDKKLIEFAKKEKKNLIETDKATLDGIINKVFKPAEGTEAVNFDALNDTEKNILEKLNIKDNDTLKGAKDTLENQVKTYADDINALTKSHEAMTDEAANVLKEKFGKIAEVFDDGKKAKALETLKDSDDATIKGIANILELDDVTKMTEDQKAIVKLFKSDAVFEGEKALDLDAIKNTFRDADYGKYVDDLKSTTKKSSALTDDILKGMKNKDDVIRNAFKKAGAWKWAGIGAAVAAVVALIGINLANKSDKA